MMPQIVTENVTERIILLYLEKIIRPSATSSTCQEQENELNMHFTLHHTHTDLQF